MRPDSLVDLNEFPTVVCRDMPAVTAAGTAWIDLAGIGEEFFSANDSWCMPDGLGHELLEASSDFELLEIEIPVPPASRVVTSAIPEIEDSWIASGRT